MSVLSPAPVMVGGDLVFVCEGLVTSFRCLSKLEEKIHLDPAPH